MFTLNQLIRKNRKKKKTKSKTPRLNNCPQKKGTCTRVFLMTPKKPNSAIRKVARVLLSNYESATCYIPGIGHNLQKFSKVVIRGGRIADLPGVRYQIIRGLGDSKPVYFRRRSRSRYGVKKFF